MRLSMLRDTIRALGNSARSRRARRRLPGRTRSSVSALLAAPMSIHRSVIFETLSILLALHQVHRLFPDHAVHRTLGPPITTRCPTRTWESQPPMPAKIQISLVVHVRDLQADLVDVAGEHEPGRALGIQRRHRVAVHVGRYLIGECLHLFAPHAGRRRLEAGRPGVLSRSRFRKSRESRVMVWQPLWRKTHAKPAADAVRRGPGRKRRLMADAHRNGGEPEPPVGRHHDPENRGQARPRVVLQEHEITERLHDRLVLYQTTGCQHMGWCARTRSAPRPPDARQVPGCA